MKRLLLSLALLGFPVLIFAKDFKLVTYYTENAGRAVFEHDVHLKALTNNCTVCHNKAFNVDHKKNPVATMADMEQGKSCGMCHNKTRAFGLAECTRCHPVKEVPIVIPDFGTLTFSHNVHTKLYLCQDCHNKIFKAGPGNPHVTMAEMEKGKSCGACHDDKAAFTVKGSCTRCHTVRDLSLPAASFFGHDYHLKKNYQCGDCHSQLFIAGPNSKRYSMLDMERGQSCGGCHNGTGAFSVKGDCGRCHRGVGDVRFKAHQALFPHGYHLNIYRCSDCHSGIIVGGASAKRYTMQEMEKPQYRSCGACHQGDFAFSVSGSCDRCHKGTREINYPIQDAGNVLFSHTFHVERYQCADCHYKVFATGSRRKGYTMAEMVKGASCGACHDGKQAFTAAANCGRCHPVKDIEFTLDALFGHDRHLQMYSCTDCHNKLFVAGPKYQTNRYTMVDMEKGKSCGGCHEGKSAFSVAGDCGKCHRTAPELTLKVQDAGNTPFSHKVHISMYTCGDCHNGIFTTGVAAKRYNMADMEKGKSCGACHDGKAAFTAAANCARCHPVKTLKLAGATFSHDFHIGLYRCNECHSKLFNPTPLNLRRSMKEMEGGKSCGACHDGKTAFSVTGNCTKCHKLQMIKFDFPDKPQTKSVKFSHKVHIGRGYECSNCHYKLYPSEGVKKPVTMGEMSQGKSCGACHGQGMIFNVSDNAYCEKCHVGETEPAPEEGGQ
ncbi:c(7)-type cytochrome triheme domain-containing protein [Geobacter sp. DSM 9736]|uniref:c(7)-type cytochrome triheme domain-containing protein n=1 Tax=Geobacter sp. DSM 9736 TaxID=1277350 RepID=UPI000B50DDED|nr:c(7)-type cytochrome triheme domain-containing protein [Geobacter sp. DSM 9736]SNB45096.1 c(7)-type cytochrome triheme domain-containing protein [Geobacter sp. DSM 9736]